MKRVLNFAEYKSAVKKEFWDCARFLDENEVDEFMNKEETKRIVSERYEIYKKDTNDGVGAPSSVGYCLGLMW